MKRQAAAAVAAAVLAAACGGAAGPGDVAVTIDGGTPQVALLGEVVVSARPGDTVTVTHGGAARPNVEAPVTHALVAAEDTLPPVFERGGGGVVPNPAVWGPCRGGDAAAATGTCPLAPGEDPESWDGASYWSLGAQLPGETRRLPLAADIAGGEHVLRCALHPQLRVVVRVGERGEAAPTQAADETAASAAAAAAGVAVPAATVLAGVEVADPPAYVARFVPEQLTVGVGQSVTWRAGGRAPVDIVFGEPELSLTHTDPADGLAEGDADGWDGRGMLRSGFLSADPSAGASAAAWTVRFTRPGTYRYATRFSDEMSGTVVVQEDDG